MNRGLTCGRNYWTNLHHARTIEQQQPLKFNFNIWCLTATTHKTILRSVKNATSTPTGESNLGSTVYRAAALTTELSGLLARKLFIHTLSRDLHDPRPGFEPGTSANRADALPLSYIYISFPYSIFCTLPVTVAQAERSFCKMAMIKNCRRSCMGQDRLSLL